MIVYRRFMRVISKIEKRQKQTSPPLSYIIPLSSLHRNLTPFATQSATQICFQTRFYPKTIRKSCTEFRVKVALSVINYLPKRPQVQYAHYLRVTMTARSIVDHCAHPKVPTIDIGTNNSGHQEIMAHFGIPNGEIIAATQSASICYAPCYAIAPMNALGVHFTIQNLVRITQTI